MKKPKTKRIKRDPKAEKVYRQGKRAYKANKKYRDNPYEEGTRNHQYWANGFGDAGDIDFLADAWRILTGS